MSADVGPPVVCADTPITRMTRTGRIATMTLQAPHGFALAGPGQFALLKALGPAAPLLPRPLSILSANEGLAFAFNVLGHGTQALAGAQPGDLVQLVGPLGTPLPAMSGHVLIVTDRSHVGGTLSLAIARGCSEETDVLYVCADANAAEDERLLEHFDATGARTEAVPPGALTRTLSEALARRPAHLVVGAADPVAAVVATFATEVESAHVMLHAPMACGLGACKVCVRRFGDGVLRRVCDGPTFPLASVAFDG